MNAINQHATNGDSTPRGISSILHATDFSDNAGTAFRWALALARAHHVPLSVLHVVHTTSISSIPLHIQNSITRSFGVLESYARSQGVTATCAWQTGKPWEVIAAEAHEHDVVVIGSHGRSTLTHIRLGSTADRVIRTSPAPVLIVHADNTPPERLPRRVLVPIDFSTSSVLALDAAVRLFRTTPEDTLHLTLLHAWQPLVEYGEVTFPVPPADPSLRSEDQAEELLEKIAITIRNEFLDAKPVVRAGYPVKVITDFVDAGDVDLIVMGTHGRSGLERFMLGSVAERVVHHAGCPVLTVNAAEKSQPSREMPADVSKAMSMAD